MNDYERMAEVIRHSRYMVALTGAGISTESGIPDFRGSGGYYKTTLPQQALSASVMYQEPERYYSEGYTIIQDVIGKTPNAAHQSLVELQQLGYLHEIITQNIDDLHARSGAQDVLQVHGDASMTYCEDCHYEEGLDQFDTRIQSGQIPPQCPKCGGLMRTNVVLFGDPMPPEFELAMDAVMRADTLLVIGSSLEVMPVAMLPTMVEHLLIINVDATPFDSSADVVIHAKAGEVMPKIVASINE